MTVALFTFSFNSQRIQNGLILLLSLQSSLPFTFDTRNPILLHDLYDKTESNFGASVSLVGPVGGIGWIVIGAPKAESPIENYSQIKEPGLIWKCSLKEGEIHNCSILTLDPIGEMNVKLGEVPRALIHHDRKDYGMLGASMTGGHELSDRFVVCSSRWINQKYRGHHLMNGLCYWIYKSDLFSQNTTWEPDFSHRLTPLVNLSRQAYTFAMPNGQVTKRGFDWAFGQAGFSVDISSKNELLLGAPGILQWSGSVVQYRDYDPIKLNPPYRRYNQKDSTFAQVLVPKAQDQISRKIIDYFEYFGYAVTSGQFFSSQIGHTQYAGGAPRGNSLGGKVLVFKFHDEDRDFGTPPDENLDVLVDPIIKESPSFFGSYFGSTLVAMDVNGDGLDDLLIGAPLYEIAAPTIVETVNISQSEENLLTSGDEGCVFLYISVGEDFDREAQEVCGDSRAGARFGTAISRLGDINHDGFEDVAIGAPYEAENRGAVYIYIGNSKGLVFAQKLRPQEISLFILGFGYSLSGEVDIDQNGYNDLAVGAYESNHVMIYKSRAVVDINGNLSTSVETLNTLTDVFSVIACLNFTGFRVPDKLEIWVKLTINPEIRKARVVEFLKDARIDPENFFRGMIQFKGLYERDGDGKCQVFNATTVGDLDLITAPVTIRMETWLAQEDRDINSTPTYCELKKTSQGYPSVEGRSENPSTSRVSKVPIQSPESKTRGSISLLIPITSTCEEDGDPVCLAQLSLNATFKTIEGNDLPEGKYLIGSSKSIVLQVELRNHRESAKLPLFIKMSWSNPLILRSSKSDCKRQNNEKERKVYTCSISTPLSKNKAETVELELDTSGLYAGAETNILDFEFIANTSSNLVEEAILKASLPLAHDSQPLLIGQSSEVSYYSNITAKTVNFAQVYEVGLRGSSPIYKMKLQVAIPQSIVIGGQTLPFLLIRKPVITYDGIKMICEPTNGTFHGDNALGSVGFGKDTSRKRRSTGTMTSRKITKVLENSITINCQIAGVECFWVDCEATSFKPSYRALVEFRLRLFTETARTVFTKKDADVLTIETLSRVRGSGQIGQERFAISRTLIRGELSGEIKAWILIVATGGGLSILTLITVCLMQCGFFRRTKLDELAKLKAVEASEFEFDELEVVDSLEYYDGALTGSVLDFKDYTGIHGTLAESYSDAIYDELDEDE